MSEAYAEVEAIRRRHVSGNQSQTGNDVIALLARHDIRLRQDDGELRQITLSIPTSVPDAHVIGLRYEKNDGSHSEDLFVVQEGRPIEACYRGSLEHKFPEYAGTHKQPLPSAIVVGIPVLPTAVNTLSMLRPR